MNQTPQIYQAFQALMIAHHAIEAGKRHTGRTDFDVSQVNDREGIVCVTAERRDLEQRLRAQGKTVHVIVMDPEEFIEHPTNIFRGSRFYHFSHGFLHALVEQELRLGQRHLSDLLKQFQRKPKAKEPVQQGFHGGNGHFF